MGAADASTRQRNIFPLPEISERSGSGPSDSGWKSFANEGIKALNELAGCLNSECHLRRKSTRAQRRVLQHISQSYQAASALPEVGDDGGLRGLCSTSRLYDSGRSDVQPYAKENISWPEVQSEPVPVTGCLPPADREWLGAWRTHMLRSRDDPIVSEAQVVPYIDPVLKHNKSEYAGFLSELAKRNMIGFSANSEYESMLGIFFVKKKSGQLRLIFDTRKLNQLFIDLFSTDLPSAEAFTRLEMLEDQPFYVASGDLANAFYTLSVPEELGRLFTLPAIEAGRVGVTTADGRLVEPDTQLTPFLKVLPMGWSWALHLCQQVLTHAIQTSGFDQSQIIGDKRSAVRLSSVQSTAVAGYVDNYGVFGSDQHSVNQGLRRISDTLRAWGLTVHEIEEAQPSADFVGLHFDGTGGYVSIKPKRIAKIRSAINELLRLQFCSGRTLQLLLGHCTWAILARREGLALLSSCYAFMHQNGERHCRLWPSVRKELTWISALLPLMRMRVNSGWAKEVTASDSSPWGVGVCHRFLDEHTVRSVGSVSERWRFKFEDATRARDHALLHDHSDEASVVAALLPGTTGAPSSFIRDLGFHEVPGPIMEKQPWSVVWSRPWQFAGNILHTEARALVWSVEHLLRANRCIGKRLVCFSDNLPLVLSATKGRGRSKHLLGPLRKLAALGLASGSKTHVRWIPSEINVADAPSRAVEQWRAARFDCWWDDETFRAGETFRKGCSASSSTEACHKRKAPARGPPIVSGITEREASHLERLSIQDAADDHVAWLRPVPDGEPHSARRDHRRVPGGHVRGREGNRRRDSSSCGIEVLPPLTGQGSNRITAPDNKGSQRVGNGVTAEAETAYPPGGPGCNHRNPGKQEPQGTCPKALHPICVLLRPGECSSNSFHLKQQPKQAKPFSIWPSFFTLSKTARLARPTSSMPQSSWTPTVGWTLCCGR